MKFKEMTEEEKLLYLESRLKKLQDFIKNVEGSGRTYTTSINIDVDELEWLVRKVKKED
jgi:hypothetical protein